MNAIWIPSVNAKRSMDHLYICCSLYSFLFCRFCCVS